MVGTCEWRNGAAASVEYNTYTILSVSHFICFKGLMSVLWYLLLILTACNYGT
jgi:hypothetical protein